MGPAAGGLLHLPLQPGQAAGPARARARARIKFAGFANWTHWISSEQPVCNIAIDRKQDEDNIVLCRPRGCWLACCRAPSPPVCLPCWPAYSSSSSSSCWPGSPRSAWCGGRAGPPSGRPRQGKPHRLTGHLLRLQGWLVGQHPILNQNPSI